MKIIPGNFHDYYDGCINQLGFSTEGNIFHRTNETVSGLSLSIKTVSYYPYKVEITEKNNNPLVVIYQNNHTRQVDCFSLKQVFKFNHFSILFCGKIYNGIRCDLMKNSIIEKQDFFYTSDEVFNFFSKNQIILREKSERFRYGSVTKGHSPNTKAWYENYFTITDISDIARENKWVTIHSTFNDKGFLGNLVLNGELKSYQFYKVFDAYSAYQELSMWVDNLAYPGNVMIDIEDKYRIAAHGFDHKYAFKKEPSKKK